MTLKMAAVVDRTFCLHVFICIAYLFTGIAASKADSKQPNILFVIIDDYGWNDIGYHGSEIRTPNLDKLAAEGIKLENYYVQPICTPSRSQLMTGRYQIHTGLQHSYILPQQPNGIPLEDPTLPDMLRKQGYATHIVGKWHLGFYKEEYTPTNRGFDSFYGYLSGGEDYYTHSFCETYDKKRGCGVDLRNNEDVVKNNTDYSTHVFTSKAQEVIRNHNADKPLFLYMSYQAVHSPLEVPEPYEEPYKFINNKARRTYAGMVACMDEGVKNLTDTLKEEGLWNNTILVFTTDNGGQILSGGNNWPLRGWKLSLWEGGLRGVGFVTGPLVENTGIYQGLMHIVDWYPTLVSLSGGSTANMSLDGYDVWTSINTGSPSPRKELLHNIDPLYGKKGKGMSGSPFDVTTRAAIRVGDYKLITGDPANSSWIAPPTYNTYKSEAYNEDHNKNIWLFNIREDPTEHFDLSQKHPDIVKTLLYRLAAYNATAVPCRFPPNDPKSNPALHGNVWGPWES